MALLLTGQIEERMGRTEWSEQAATRHQPRQADSTGHGTLPTPTLGLFLAAPTVHFGGTKRQRGPPLKEVAKSYRSASELIRQIHEQEKL